MPNCWSYVLAKDRADPAAIWITEVWQDREARRASQRLPSVQQDIAKARPLIAAFGERFETEPVGRWSGPPERLTLWLFLVVRSSSGDVRRASRLRRLYCASADVEVNKQSGQPPHRFAD
jgi:hypothetical protein